MFEFNSKTVVNRTLKKNELTKLIQMTPEIRQEMKYIEVVSLSQVLSYKTLHIEEKESCREIYVFDIQVSDKEVPYYFIKALDEVTALHTYFIISAKHLQKELCIYRIVTSECIKRHKLYETPWQEEKNSQLPHCTNMLHVYEALVESIIPLQKRDNEGLNILLHRHEQVQKIAKQIKSLEQKAAREKQPKKKFELARQLRELQGDFNQLKEN